MKITRLVGGILESNGYIVYDQGKGIIIDPGYKGENFIKKAKDLNIEIMGIYLTHHHHDHVGGVQKIRDELGCPVYIHRNDGDMYGEDATYIEDGYKFKVGQEEFVTLLTQGHTEGGVCYMCERTKAVFTGDTIFNIDLGRTDLEDGNQGKMEETILNIANFWSNEYTIYPGHGDNCTMKYVRANNQEFNQIAAKEVKIKLIALDLDGTTLNSQGQITSRTKQALHKAMEKGVHVVIATGRCFAALPQEITNIEEIQYAITSNGGLVSEIKTGRMIAESCIDPSAIEGIINVLKELPFMIEVFSLGKAYINRDLYEEIERGGLTYRHREYVLATRKPVKSVMDFMRENSTTIENINIFFDTQKEKKETKELLEEILHVTITSSLDSNWEIGGENTSKGEALKKLAKKLGIKKEEILACGDSPNDGAMLKMSGIPVAVSNAKDEVKKMAKFITASNDEDGVAKAIEKYVR